MPEKSSIFDMIGPVMIGPSSSHTAGVVRIGRVAHELVGKTPKKADIIFYNSFARTYEGHGSDKAILAGLMGLDTDDKKIKTIFDVVPQSGMTYSFKSAGNASTLHPNSIRVTVSDEKKEWEIVGESRGGGQINIAEVNGFNANFTASLHTLIIFAADVKGSIAFISDVIAHDESNIATMSVSRKGKNDLACLVIEMDTVIRPITLDYLRSLNWIRDVVYLPNVIK